MNVPWRKYSRAEVYPAQLHLTCEDIFCGPAHLNCMFVVVMQFGCKSHFMNFHGGLGHWRCAVKKRILANGSFLAIY